MKKSREKNQITSKNLQRLAAESGLTLKALRQLYISEDGQNSPNTVTQHWYGHRAIAWKAMDKYIRIFKMFNRNVTHQDFFRN